MQEMDCEASWMALVGIGIEEASDTRAFTSDWRVSGVWV